MSPALRRTLWTLMACAAAVSSLEGTLDLGAIGAGIRTWVVRPPASALLRVTRAASQTPPAAEPAPAPSTTTVPPA